MSRGQGRAPRKATGQQAGELVACVGGRLDGAWFHPADWQAERDADQWTADTHGTPPARSLRYVRTDDWAAHPKPLEWPDGGRVWRHKPQASDE